MTLKINVKTMTEDLLDSLMEIKDIAENWAICKGNGVNKININGNKLRGDVTLEVYNWILDALNGNEVEYTDLRLPTKKQNFGPKFIVD